MRCINCLMAFESYSYHLEHAMDLCEAQNAAERCSTIFAKLFKAIRMHNQFIKFVSILWHNFSARILSFRSSV